MKILVTGATGFIGKALVRRLLQKRFEIVCAGRSLHKLVRFLDRIKFFYLDIRDRKRVEDIFRKERPEVVFHCAALTGDQSLKPLRQVNVGGTKNVFDACAQSGVNKIIYLSSTSVIAGSRETFLTEELPYAATNRYGQSKVEAEQLSIDYRKKGLKIAILRPAMVYGEEDTHVISLLIDLIRWRLFPVVGSGENRFPLVYVENLIDVMILSIFDEAAYKGTYLIADKEVVSFKELFGYIAEALGSKQPFYLPRFLIPFLIRFPFVGRRFRIFLEDKVCSINNLQENLGYTPRVSFYDGIRKTVFAHRGRY